MVRILNCFHTLADPEILSDSEWQEGCSKGHIDTSYIRKTINASDESGLELACRFRDKAGQDEEVTLAALTIGDSTANRVLKTLSSIGFDRVVRIGDGSSVSSITSEKAAALIAEWTRTSGSFDLIITGQQSGDGNMGKVPSLTAEDLGITCLAGVTDFTPADENGAYAVWVTDGTVYRGYVEYPAVLAIGVVSDAYLRVPTIKQRMSRDNAVPEILEAEDIVPGISTASEGCGPVLLSMEAVDESRDTVMISGTDAHSAAQAMAAHYRKWVTE